MKTFAFEASFKLSILLFIVFLSKSVFAAPTPRYLWSDTKGFLPVEASCQVKNEDQILFHIAQKPHSQLNSYSKMKGLGFFGSMTSSFVLDRSLIATKQLVKSAAEAEVRILSIPKNTARATTRDISKVGDEGSLFTESLQDIGNFILEVVEAPAVSGKAPFKVPKSFWQTSIENEKFMTLNCGTAAKPLRYVLFDVYDSTSIDPIAQVGLQTEETKIFNIINVYTPDEANQVVSAEEPIQKESPPPSAGAVAVGIRGAAAKPPTSQAPEQKNSDDNSISEGDLEYILCTEDKTISVLDKDLKNNLFTAKQFESLIPNQTWDEKQKSTHLEVRFTNRSETPNVGWIPRALVQLRSECEPLKKNPPEEENEIVDDSLDSLDPRISRKDCCHFPTKNRASEAYTSGTLQFRAKRNNGRRLHAGCDLYRKKGEAAIAVASGTVIRGMYYFYQGIFAIEIKHPKFIARYGEVTGRAPKGVAKGKNVVAGQEVGYIGKVNSGCCAPMLHFEMYKGTGHGSLTRYRLPPYDRRSDIMDPTDFLKQWEQTQFGKSY